MAGLMQAVAFLSIKSKTLIKLGRLCRERRRRWGIRLLSVVMRSGFYFLLGTVWGVYMAQNYNVPNVKRLVNTGIIIARAIEQGNRKSKRDDDDDDD